MPPAAAKRAKIATKRVIVQFDQTLFERTEKAALQLATNRSDLIRSAVEQYLKAMQRRALERQLADGYLASAALDRQVSEEFSHVDAEI